MESNKISNPEKQSDKRHYYRCDFPKCRLLLWLRLELGECRGRAVGRTG